MDMEVPCRVIVGVPECRAWRVFYIPSLDEQCPMGGRTRMGKELWPVVLPGGFKQLLMMEE